jgi:hypothetical protein
LSQADTFFHVYNYTPPASCSGEDMLQYALKET